MTFIYEFFVQIVIGGALFALIVTGIYHIILKLIEDY